jgi:hypothetical protein
VSRSEEVKFANAGMLRRRHAQLAVVTILAAILCFIVASGRAKRRAKHGTAAPAWPATGFNQNQTRKQSAGEVYKNIQALKDLPASEIDGAMNFMSAALGVGCTYCHTNPWASDEKPAKLAARRMILMTLAINREHFSGNPAVTCYTCHRGQHNSAPNPPPDVAALHSPDDVASAPKPASLPSTDEIIDRYKRAIGGEAATAKIKTLVVRGTETTINRMTPAQTAPIEIYQTTQNKLLIIRNNPRGTTSEGFDGIKGLG